MVYCIKVGIRGSSDKHSDLVLNVWVEVSVLSVRIECAALV